MASDALSDEKVTREKVKLSLGLLGRSLRVESCLNRLLVGFFHAPRWKRTSFDRTWNLRGQVFKGLARAGNSWLHPADWRWAGPVPWYLGAAESILVYTL